MALQLAAALREFTGLPCVTRSTGEPLEMKLVRKQLADREAHISMLEQALQQREETRTVLAAEHESLQRQLDDARTLITRAHVAQTAWRAAEAASQRVLAAPPTVHETREPTPTSSAKRRAGIDAEYARLTAAAERSAAIDADYEAPTRTAEPAVPVAEQVRVEVVQASPPPPPPPPPPPLPPPTAGASQIAVSAPRALCVPAAISPALVSPPPVPASVGAHSAVPVQAYRQPEKSAKDSSVVEEVAALAASPLASPRVADEVVAEVAAEVAAAAEVEAALLQAAPPPHLHRASVSDDEDFDTMGWPDGTLPHAVSASQQQPATAAHVDIADENASADLFEQMRAEAALAASKRSSPLTAINNSIPMTIPHPPAVRAFVNVRLFFDYQKHAIAVARVRLVAGGNAHAAMPTLPHAPRVVGAAPVQVETAAVAQSPSPTTLSGMRVADTVLDALPDTQSGQVPAPVPAAHSGARDEGTNPIVENELVAASATRPMLNITVDAPLLEPSPPERLQRSASGGEDDEYSERTGDDDVDSDFELAGIEPPSKEPILQDYLCLSKLYGHSGGAPWPEDIEWERRWVSLYEDGSLWHADNGPSEVIGGACDGLVGRIELVNVLKCDFSEGHTDELCLSQSSKCHLLRLDDASSTSSLPTWCDSISKLRAR